MVPDSKTFLGKSLFGFLVSIFLCSLFPAFAAMDEEAGRVIAARKQAWADRSRDRAPLAGKSPVYAGDLLITNEIGRLQVLFKDDSIFMMAPDSQARVTEYLYGETGNNRFNLDLARGITRIISGRITEEGGMIEVKTPRASVGIQGTDVLVHANSDDSTEVAVLQGKRKKPVQVCANGVLRGKDTSLDSTEVPVLQEKRKKQARVFANDAPRENCLSLEPRQGVIVSGTGLRFMTPDEFGSFTNSSQLQAGGVLPPSNGSPGTNPPRILAGLSQTSDGPTGGLSSSTGPQNLSESVGFTAADASVTYSGTFNSLGENTIALGYVLSSGTGTYALTVTGLLESPTITDFEAKATLLNDYIAGSISIHTNAHGANLGTVGTGGVFNLQNPGTTEINGTESLGASISSPPYTSTVSGTLPETGSGQTSIPGITWDVGRDGDTFVELKDIQP